MSERDNLTAFIAHVQAELNDRARIIAMLRARGLPRHEEFRLDDSLETLRFYLRWAMDFRDKQIEKMWLKPKGEAEAER